MARRNFWLLMIALILTACQEDSPPSLDNNASQSAELVIWHNEAALQEPLSALLDAYKTEQPALNTDSTLYEEEIFREETINAIRAGGGPDVILGREDDLRALAEAGLLTPLDSSLSSSGKVGTWRQRTYGIPLYIDTPLIYSAEETSASTFDAFLAAAEQLGAVVSPRFERTAAWIELGTSASLNIAPSGFQGYLERLERLRGTPGVIFSDTPEAFLAGDAGLYIGSSREYVTLRAAYREALQSAPFSGPMLGEPLYIMMSLNATTRSIETAEGLITFLLRTESQDALRAVLGFPTQNVQVILPPVDDPFYSETLPRLEMAISQVLSGVLPPPEAAQSAFPAP